MKTYTAKSSATRAGKKAGVEFEIKQVENGSWIWFAKTKSAPKLNKSIIENPCAFVWNMAQNMKGARRKDVINACVNEGVAYYTARTQYQQWLTVSKN